MKMVILQHAEMDTPGTLLDWTDMRSDIDAVVLRLDEGIELPEVDSFDWVVSLGGPMNADEDDVYPWMAPEKVLLRRAIEDGKRVLGICLGAQLMARAFGARVTPNKYKEVGWWPVELTADGTQDPLFGFMPHRQTLYHWHGDTFEIPEGATHVATSVACRNQAFTMGPRVVGLQFHMEMSLDVVRTFVESGVPEPETYVQSGAEMIAGAGAYADSTNFFELLNRMADDSWEAGGKS